MFQDVGIDILKALTFANHLKDILHLLNLFLKPNIAPDLSTYIFHLILISNN